MKTTRTAANIELGNYLRGFLKPGDTVSTLINHVSRSGMSRRVKVFAVRDGQIAEITHGVAQIIGSRVDDRGVYVGGCGFDAGYEVVYQLGFALFPDGFTCPGEGCQHNDHSNYPQMPRDAGDHHNRSGYVFRHRGL
jgi:hypothetical protein